MFLQWVFVACHFPPEAEVGKTFVSLTHTHAHTHKGLYPAVTPHSRQMGDICSLEIFLHYCHRGTSLNVCFPALLLMRTCLLKWWSTWQRTFTWRRARTDHTCDSVLSGGAGWVTSARCTHPRPLPTRSTRQEQRSQRWHLYRLRLWCVWNWNNPQLPGSSRAGAQVRCQKQGQRGGIGERELSWRCQLLALEDICTISVAMHWNLSFISAQLPNS